MQDFGKQLIFIGIIIVLAGIIVTFSLRLSQWLGRLPGDINKRIPRQSSEMLTYACTVSLDSTS